MLAVAWVLLVPQTGWAQGDMLHGVGPVNSSMGGAGVALSNESIGALAVNPALITGVAGNQISFATEFFKDALRITARAGAVTGTTDATGQTAVVPAFGWMLRKPDGKLALGFGLLGVAGFRTDYPQDNANPVLRPQPVGFGHIFSDYTLTKIPLAFAYQATPKLAIGGSFNLYRGTLSLAPLAFVEADKGPSANTYLPVAGSINARFGVGGQFGFVYKASEMASVGASYTTFQRFQEYKWNSTVSNPEVPQYGAPRVLNFRLDGPASFTFGVGLKPNAKTMLAIDAQWTKFDSVEGLGGPGGVDLTSNRLVSIGWRNVWTVKTGVQYQATPKLAVRAGYNQSQTPIRSELAEGSLWTPATFQKHLSGGLGMQVFPNISADLGFYFVPREHVKGPLLSPQTGAVPDGEIDLSNGIKSLQIAFNFRF